MAVEVEYLDEVKEVFTVLWDAAKGELEKEWKQQRIKSEDYPKYLVKLIGNVINNATKYPLTLAQIKLVEKQADEVDKLTEDKKALLAAQVKGEIAKAILTIRQVNAYDDNILAKVTETVGNTLGMIAAGEGLVEEKTWGELTKALEAFKGKLQTDDARLTQLVDDLNKKLVLSAKSTNTP
jgi:hypothetical protein